MSLLHHYKNFVKQHPALVLNGERVLHYLTYWAPERFESSGYTYEALSAAVGLLGIYNESILADTPEYNGRVAKWALWLAAMQQMQTLVELRAIQMEQRGKMSRYGPLIFLELIKVVLRLQLWSSSKCRLALESVSTEDQEKLDCEQQLKELMQALTRLRERYSCEPLENPSAEQLHYQEQLQREQEVRAAAIAPNRPPAACAAGELARHAALDVSSTISVGSGSFAQSCSALGTASLVTNSSSGLSSSCRGHSCGVQHISAAEQQCCPGGSRTMHLSHQQQQQQQGSFVNPQHGDAASADAAAATSIAQQRNSKFRQGWWQRISRLYPGASAVQSGKTQEAASHQQQMQPELALSSLPPPAAAAAGALAGSWGPGLRELYSTAPNMPSCCGYSSSGRGASLLSASSCKQQRRQHNSWCLSNRDDSIGHSVMWVGEVVHLLRPLVYVALLKRYGLRSWKPWVLSLMLDLASGYGLHTGYAILTHCNASRWPTGSTLYSLALLRSLSSNRWSPGEQAELLGRRVQLLRYLLRSPCYDAVTRRLLQKVVSGTRWMPGLSNLTEFAFSMIEGMQSYYTYVEC